MKTDMTPEPAHDLWLDIGNTRLKYWLMQGETLVQHGAELHLQSPAEFLLGLMPFLRHQNIQRVGIASVLDGQTNARLTAHFQHAGLQAQFIEVQADYQGLQLAYAEPSRLGIDRWLHLLALNQRGNYVIAGCGTALTLDILQGHVHQGGYILPGLYLQRDSLVKGTRRIQIEACQLESIAPGHDTDSAVQHGILLGLLAAIDQVAKRYPEYHLVLTGGDAELLAKRLAHDFQRKATVMPDLLLSGIRQYFQ